MPFYGRQVPASDVPKINAPLLLHYAQLDTRINEGWPAYEAVHTRLVCTGQPVPKSPAPTLRAPAYKSKTGFPRFPSLSAAARTVLAIGCVAHIGLTAFAVRHKRLQLILKLIVDGSFGACCTRPARCGRTLETRLTRRKAALTALLSRLTRLLRLRLLDRKIDTACLINIDDLYLDLLALLQEILDVVYKSRTSGRSTCSLLRLLIGCRAIP